MSAPEIVAWKWFSDLDERYNKGDTAKKFGLSWTLSKFDPNAHLVGNPFVAEPLIRLADYNRVLEANEQLHRHGELMFADRERLLEAAKAVEKWWLERGMQNQREGGCPAEIFNLRRLINGWHDEQGKQP